MESGKGYSDIRRTGQQFKESHIALAMVFAILYVPFVYLYGYKFLHAEAIDLPSYWCAAKAAFGLSLSPYRRDVLQGILPSQYVYAYVYPPFSLPHLLSALLRSLSMGKISDTCSQPCVGAVSSVVSSI